MNLNASLNQTYEIISNNLTNQILHGSDSAAASPYKSDYYSLVNNQPLPQQQQQQQSPSSLHALMTAMKSNFHMPTQQNEANTSGHHQAPPSPIKHDTHENPTQKANTGVIHELVSSVLGGVHLAPSQSQHSPQETKQANKKSDFISQLVTSAYNRNPTEDPNLDQQQPQFETTNRTIQQTNHMNNDTLIKEYERELKRQDTNMGDFTLTSSLNFLNPFQSTSAVDNNNTNQQANQKQQLREHFHDDSKGATDLNKWSESPVIRKTDFKIENREAAVEQDDLSEIKRKK